MEKKNYAPSSRTRFLLEHLRYYAHWAIVPLMPQKGLSMGQSPVDMLSIRESWRMFKILTEIVNGFGTLGDLGPCVSAFGSARVEPESPLCAKDGAIAKLLVESGYGVTTGDGPGLMEAGNKGTTEAGGTSVSLHIRLPREQECNKYVKIHGDYRYFFLRRLMFVKYALAYVVMPGGMGTVGELSEAFVLAQTKRIRPLPITLYQSTFWNGFLDWVRSTVVSGGCTRASEVDDLVTVYDTPGQVAQQIRRRVIL